MTKKLLSQTAWPTSIKQHLDQLPQAEKRLANVILESPGQLASYSASEVTRMAGVSNATMTRLVHRLGYENYDQMRRLAREGKDWGSPLYLMDRRESDEGEGCRRSVRPAYFGQRAKHPPHFRGHVAGPGGRSRHRDRQGAAGARVRSTKQLFFCRVSALAVHSVSEQRLSTSGIRRNDGGVSGGLAA